MHNPNKIHSVEMTLLHMENKKTPIPINVTIRQQMEGAPDEIKKIYKISPLPGRSPELTNAFEVEVFIPEHQLDKDTPMHYAVKINDIERYIYRLKRRFNFGRYAISTRWKTLPNAYSKSLTYQQAKRLLNFERKASRFVHEKPEAVRQADPKLIKAGEIIDCDKYIIESWMLSLERNHYTCTTFDSKIIEWFHQQGI